MSDERPVKLFPSILGVRFRAISGSAGYCVGSDGTVWSCYRTHHWKQLSVYTTERGYQLVSICICGGSPRTCLVHRLILEAFHGPARGMAARHLNGNASDNRIENLKWGTRKENESDKVRHGTLPHGERQYASRLKASDIPTIFELYNGGISRKAISVAFGVCQGVICNVLDKRSWVRHSEYLSKVKRRRAPGEK